VARYVVRQLANIFTATFQAVENSPTVAEEIPMEKTTRRNLLRAAAAGGAAAAGLGAVLGSERAVAALSTANKNKEGSEVDEHNHQPDVRPLSGKHHAQATVAFGQWDANPENPFDRQPVNNDRFRNIHKLLPFEVDIHQGGAVSFIISGLHQIMIYEDGTSYESLFAAWDQAGRPLLPAAPPFPPLIDFATGRVYRGLDPRVLNYLRPNPAPDPPSLVSTQDRVESVNFPAPGRYLVVCGVMGHFLEAMHGYVTVRERD
jgi:hypothetical protein